MPQGVYPRGNRGLFQKGHITWNKGKKDEYKIFPNGRIFSETTKLKMGKARLGKVPHNKGKGKPAICKSCEKEYTNNRKKYCSQECKSQVYPWNRGKESLQIRGEKNPNWRGGVSTKNERIRKSLQYEIWRKEVYQRDRWICRICERKCPKGTIVAHHIKLFSGFPELRFSVDNGLTLCRGCHARLHKTKQ